MTLEKLLIFGFALAVLMAITTMGSGIWDNRTQRSTDFEAELDTF